MTDTTEPGPAKADPGHNQSPSLPALVLSQMLDASFEEISEVVIGLGDQVTADPYAEKRAALMAAAAVWQDGEKDAAGNVTQPPVTELLGEDYEKPAVDLGTGLSKLEKDDDKQREFVKAPFLAVTRNIDKVFNKDRREPAIRRRDYLAKLVQDYKNKLRAAALEAERKRLADLKAAEEAEAEAARKLAEAGPTATTQEVQAVRAAEEATDRVAAGVVQAQQQIQESRIVRGHGGAAASREEHTLVIVDLALIPRAYLVLDEGKAKAALLAGRKIPDFQGIPGLRLDSKPVTSFR